MWLFHSEKLVCWKQIITKLILKNQTLTVSSLKKMSFCNYTVLRARNFFKRSQLLYYYKTHVNPIVQYGVLIYGCTSYSNLDPNLKIQKQIVRSICCFPKYASVHQFKVENELPTVYELHVCELLKTIIGCERSEHVHDKKRLLPSI